ncbi:MAG: trypsin-like peptidase domain-containing protein [Verrucomicrobiota bacterium]
MSAPESAPGGKNESEALGPTMPKQHKIQIDSLSLPSLPLTAFVNGLPLGSATGFVVTKSGKSFLITNWHVVSGRHPDTNQPSSSTGGIPDELQVMHHLKRGLGNWGAFSVRLLDAVGNPGWLEHSSGQRVDVVAIPLDPLPADVQLYPMNLALANVDLMPEPGIPVFIIGFPGISVAGALPVWKTGHLASDHDVDYSNKPAFLIDATTRGGMSGSPVVARMSGGYRSSQAFVISSGMTTRFLGVYSGRVRDNSEIGIVWRPIVIDDILRNQ